MTMPFGVKTIATYAIAMIAAFMAGLSTGWKFVGYPRGYEAGIKGASVVNEALNTVAVDTMRGKQACEVEVRKTNVEVDRQREQNRKILIDDRAATQIAIEAANKSAASAALAMTQTQRNIQEARNEIAKIKDACVNAGVPADFFMQLNRALETESPAIQPATGSQVP